MEEEWLVSPGRPRRGSASETNRQAGVGGIAKWRRALASGKIKKLGKRDKVKLVAGAE